MHVTCLKANVDRVPESETLSIMLRVVSIFILQ